MSEEEKKDEEEEKIRKGLGMGWFPDYPDFRDLDMNSTDVPPRLKESGRGETLESMMTTLKMKTSASTDIPPSYNVVRYCSPIEDQGNIGSCTAHAGVGLLEYFERRAFGRHIDGSRLFLYKATRNLLQLTGDTGAFNRTTMAAMALFGVPPEEYYPYDESDYDKEPSAFCYTFAQNYQAIQYFRHDTPNIDRDDLLDRIKLFLYAKIPSMFGFTVFSSINQSRRNGEIPFPSRRDKVRGGHAVMAVGYDDNRIIKNRLNGNETKGAILIRNSWGSDWGRRGYGWLPYEYVKTGLARDWWSLIRNEYVETGRFGL